MRLSNRGSVLDMFSSLALSWRAKISKKRLKNLKIGPQQPHPPLTPIGSGRDLRLFVDNR